MSPSTASRVRTLNDFRFSTTAHELTVAHSGTTMQIQKGQIVLTPYAVVEQLLAMDNVELI